MIFLTRLSEKRRAARARRYIGCDSGATVVEFALVAPLLFATVLSAFEAGLMYMKVSMAEMAMDDVTRLLYTGQAQNNELTSSDIADLFCSEMRTVITCDGNVTVQVEVLPGFDIENLEAPTCIHSGDGSTNDDLPNYSSSSGGDIIFVRFCVTTELVVPALSSLVFKGVNIGLRLPESADGKYAITASTLFRAEPFTNNGGNGGNGS